MNWKGKTMKNEDKSSEYTLETDSGTYSVRLRDKGIEVARDGEVIFTSRGVEPYPKADLICIKPSFLERDRRPLTDMDKVERCRCHRDPPHRTCPSCRAILGKGKGVK